MKEQFTARARAIQRLFAAATIMLTLGGCGLESPQAPSWDTTLTIPLINRTYTSAELFEKLANDNIDVDEDGNSSLNIQKALDTISIQSILELDPVQSNFAKEVGRIKIVSPENQQQSLEFSNLVPLVLGVVPDTGITATTNFGQASSFSSAEFDEGSISIQASNNTGFDLDSLTGRLMNSQDGALVATFVTPGGLGDGEQFSQQFELAGKNIGSQLDFEVFFHTAGGQALTLADRSIDFAIDYSDNIYVSSVNGKVEAFENTYSDQAKISEEVDFQSAQLAVAQMHLTAQNTLPSQANLEFVFPQVTRDGSPLTLSYNVFAGGTLDESIVLDGWTVNPSNDSITAELHLAVPGSGDNYIQLDAEDEVHVAFAIENIALASATAIVPQTQLSIENVLVDIQIPTGFDNVTLDMVELTVSVDNYSDLSGEVELLLQASNGKSLQVFGSVIGRGGNSASVNQIYSDQLADLLNPIPEHIEVSGVALVGDGATVIEIAESDYFFAKAVISAPMAFKISQATVEGDKNSLEVSDDFSDAADRLHSGSFKSTVKNHLPLGAQMSIYIGADSASLFSSPLTVIGPISFSSAMTDANGLVTEEISTQSSFTLDSDDLRVFENRDLYVAPVLELSGSNGQTVRIRAADYFTISGVIEITARVGGEE